MSIKRLITLLTALITISSASDAKQSPTTVACVGDSITFGYGLKPADKRYPQVLQELLGDKFAVKGFGNSGKTAGDYPGQKGRWYGSTNEHKKAVDYAADIYICNLGINDTGAWWNADLFTKGYNDLFTAWKQANPKAKFFAWGKLGPDYRGPVDKPAFPGNCFTDVRKYSLVDNGSSAKRPEAEKLIKGVAKKHKVVLFDAYTLMANHPEWYTDGLHPLAEGARRIAEITFTQLVKSLKLSQPTPKITSDENGLTVSNPGSSGILLDGFIVSDGSQKMTLSNATVIHPGASITITTGSTNQDDPTKPLTIKSKKSPKSLKLIKKK